MTLFVPPPLLHVLFWAVCVKVHNPEYSFGRLALVLFTVATHWGCLYVLLGIPLEWIVIYKFLCKSVILLYFVLLRQGGVV